MIDHPHPSASSRTRFNPSRSTTSQASSCCASRGPSSPAAIQPLPMLPRVAQRLETPLPESTPAPAWTASRWTRCLAGPSGACRALPRLLEQLVACHDRRHPTDTASNHPDATIQSLRVPMNTPRFRQWERSHPAVKASDAPAPQTPTREARCCLVLHPYRPLRTRMPVDTRRTANHLPRPSVERRRPPSCRSPDLLEPTKQPCQLLAQPPRATPRRALSAAQTKECSRINHRLQRVQSSGQPPHRP